MFEHVSLLLSFVYVVALTHLLAAATELITARDRVKPSGLMIFWMVQATMLLLINWLSLFGLSDIKQWTVREVGMQFGSSIVQYFTCSLISMRVKEEGPVDMPAYFEKQRPVIFASFLALALIAMVTNYLDRNNTNGMTPDAWVGEDLLILPIVLVLPFAAYAKRKWLQWTAAVLDCAALIYFLTAFTIPA
jgi:hypothetical protein